MRDRKGANLEVVGGEEELKEQGEGKYNQNVYIV